MSHRNQDTTNAIDAFPFPYRADQRVAAWRDASRVAAEAYDAWRHAPREGRRVAYAVYLAAADQEAAAARALEPE